MDFRLSDRLRVLTWGATVTHEAPTYRILVDGNDRVEIYGPHSTSICACILAAYGYTRRSKTGVPDDVRDLLPDGEPTDWHSIEAARS